MRYILYLLFFLLNASESYCKGGITIRNKLNTSKIDTDTSYLAICKVSSIQIQNLNTGHVQILKPNYGKKFKYSYNGINSNDVKLKDINDDGFDDLFVTKNYSDNYFSYSEFCFLYNPLNGTFYQLPWFDTIHNPVISDKNIILSELRFTFFNQIINTYKVLDNKLIRISNEVQSLINQNDSIFIKSIKDSLGNIIQRSSLVRNESFNKSEIEWLQVINYKTGSYVYSLYYDSINRNNDATYLIVHDSTMSLELAKCELIYQNIRFEKWLLTNKDLFPKEFIQEIDLNQDGKMDFIISGGGWSTSKAVFVYNSDRSKFLLHRELDNPSKIKPGVETISYYTFPPCGTLPVTFEKNICKYIGGTYVLQNQIIYNYCGRGSGKIAESIKYIDFIDGYPQLRYSKLTLMSHKKYEKLQSKR